MKSLSTVGLGLSIVFVVLFLALIAELYYLLWWKKSSLNPQETQQQPSQLVHHLQSDKDLFFKPYDDDGLDPPRSLFTIVEETKEDLECEEAKSKKGKSLSDVVFSVETPYLTPLASPPLTPLEAASCCYNHHGSFNPLFESSNGGDFNISSSSPPTKFKFLQEAEKKPNRKKMLHQWRELIAMVKEDGSFTSIIVGKSKENRV